MNTSTRHEMSLAVNHISVDCVVLGFDGEQLRVLLLKRVGELGGQEFGDMKLPGDLIYTDEKGKYSIWYSPSMRQRIIEE